MAKSERGFLMPQTGHTENVAAFELSKAEPIRYNAFNE
jgi:hypothetical protein